MSAWKIIISVFTALGSCFVALVAFAVLMVSIDSIAYDAEYDIQPRIIDARAVYIGDTYPGYEQEEGLSYYEVWLTVENSTNFSHFGNMLYVYFESADMTEYYYVNSVDRYAPFDSWDDGQYIPAGKQAEISYVISVDEACDEILVEWQTENYDEYEQMTIDLKKG